MLLRIILIFLNVQFLFGQITNVNLPIPKIETRNLESVVFQNGQRLKIIRETDQDYEKSWVINSENPTVFITNAKEYLYNYPAIVDERNICPVNYRVISKSDLENLVTNNITKLNISLKKYSDKLDIYPSTIFEPEGCEIIFNLYTPNTPHVAVNSTKPPKIENGKSVGSMTPVLSWDLEQRQLRFGSRNDNTGLPVRCLENLDLNKYFNNNILKYKDLRLSNLQILQDSIKRKIQFSQRVSESINVNVVFSFNENGSLLTVFPKENNLLKFLPKMASKILEPPFYKKINIRTVDTLQFRIFPYNRKDTMVSLDLKITSISFQNYLKVNSLGLLKNLENCTNQGAKAKLRYPMNMLIYEGESLVSTQIPSLKRVVCPGPVNALFSVIPGLGVYQFKQTGQSYRKLLSVSLSLAAISIASKAVSLSFYNRFRINIDGLDATKNYQIANTSQKVFVVSSAIYGALFLVDFTWTISLGINSKHVQYQTNSELRKMHKKGIWI